MVQVNQADGWLAESIKTINHAQLIQIQVVWHWKKSVFLFIFAS